MNKKRMIITLITGAILGVVCIIGAQLRSGGVLQEWYLFAFWFNRLLMGMVFGFLPTNINLPKRLIRGAILGLIISFSFYVATVYFDTTGFLVGIVYGMIIEAVAYKLDK